LRNSFVPQSHYDIVFWGSIVSVVSKEIKPPTLAATSNGTALLLTPAQEAL